MKTQWLLGGSIILTMIGVARAEMTVGSGKLVEEDRKVSAFDEISVSAGIHVTVVPGSATSVKVKGDENIVPLVETRVMGDELKIGFKRGTSIRTSQAMPVTITVSNIKGLSASGGSQLTSTVPGKGSLEVESSGGSHVTLKDLAVKRLDVDASGGSVVEVQGKADQLEFDGSGGTVFQGDRLTVAKASVDASGGSQVHVTGASQVEADISGGVTVYASKTANVEVSKSGGAQVIKE